MKLSEYSKYIGELAQKHPDFDVIYASDDEGNKFYPLVFPPTAGHYDENRDFLGEDDLDDDQKLNAICVN